MGKYLVSSDWHCNPAMEEGRRARIRSFMRYCVRKENDSYGVVLPGDLLDILEFGSNAIHQDPFCREVAEWAHGRNRIRGNHDAEPGLPPYIVIDGIYISHWHEFDMLWGWLPIREFPVPAWLVRLYKTPASRKGELLDYHLSTIQVEYRATKMCVKKGYRGIVGGHTHAPFTQRREGYLVANCGDMVDSFSWLELNTTTLEAEVRRLE